MESAQGVNFQVGALGTCGAPIVSAVSEEGSRPWTWIGAHRLGSPRMGQARPCAVHRGPFPGNETPQARYDSVLGF